MFDLLEAYSLQVMACRTGRMAANRLSGAAVVVMMVESFVPIGAHFKSLHILSRSINMAKFDTYSA